MKRHQVDSKAGFIESMDQRNPNEYGSADEHSVTFETDKSQSSNASREEEDVRGRDSHAIMNCASQSPYSRNAPPSSNDAMIMFNQYSRDLKIASMNATAGSEESDFDFVQYQERRQISIERRERFFRSESDEVLKTVDHLFRRWTYNDAPHGGQADRTTDLALLQAQQPG